MKKMIKSSVDWSYYNNERFDRIDKLYLPDKGEGDTMATQIVVAVNKLIYKWYNDGDVYDNTGSLEGFANDLSSYANWLYKYVPESKSILIGVTDCYNDSQYERLLKKLADTILDEEDLEHYSEKPKVGSVYDCDGPFQFSWIDDKDEDEDEDEEGYW